MKETHKEMIEKNQYMAICNICFEYVLCKKFLESTWLCKKCRDAIYIEIQNYKKERKEK